MIDKDHLSGSRYVRTIVGCLTLSLTILATVVYWTVLEGGGGLNIVELLSVPLFTVLFTWIAFSFLIATVGFVTLLNGRRNRTDQPPSKERQRSGDRARTAVVMPVYNESPTRVFAGIKAMYESVRELGLEDEFDFYILSDTTDAEIWLEEEVAWSELVKELGVDSGVFYRHRAKNTSRKAGNIAEFCTNWGNLYSYMIVLDADSLMEAETMHEMVARMDRDEKLGILQVPPVPMGRFSLMARLQQFAAHVYGPVFVAGFARWAGDEGNYWGHNAIIRVRPFMEHCSLPILPGAAPLGGEILSHDFVEAALMLRAGYKVQLAIDLGGSYEECPTTISDFAQRDQRWCQGNLQHTQLILAENFRPLSRLHFLSGVMSYAASPLWLLFLSLCVLGTGVDALNSPGDELPLLSRGWLAFGLFFVSMAFLLVPKLWGVIILSRDKSEVTRYGGEAKLIQSALIETIASVLLSPIMAIYHSRFVVATLQGRKVTWSAQQRNDSAVTWLEAVEQFAVVSLFGMFVGSLLFIALPGLFVWFLPVLIGMVFSIPISVWMGSVRVGNWLHRSNLLLIPEDLQPCELTCKQKRGIELFEKRLARPDQRTRFEMAIGDPKFYSIHTRVQRSRSEKMSVPTDQVELVRHNLAHAKSIEIPNDLRRSVLQDLELFRSLHVDAQCQSAK